MVLYLIAIGAIKLFSSLAQFIKAMDTFHVPFRVSFRLKYMTLKYKTIIKTTLKSLIKYLAHGNYHTDLI